MRNPKIVVIGASASELAQIKILLASKDIDLVELPDEADAVVDVDWVLKNTVEYTASPDIPEVEVNCTEHDYDDGAQHWRGGARKKGGKIGYRRG